MDLFTKMPAANLRSELKAGNILFGREIYVYPPNILVWHEIVNKEVNGEKLDRFQLTWTSLIKLKN